MRPSTIASRRATWGDDARQLVADLRRAARGEGGEPWRIAYLAGARIEPVKSEKLIMLRTAGIKPGTTNLLMIGLGTDTVSQQDVDAIAWHMDQDARRGDEDPDERERLPAGTLLVDPLFATLLGQAGVDERSLRCQLESTLETIEMRRRRATPLRMPYGFGTPWVQVVFNMNEIRAEFDMPGTSRATWKSGYLDIERGNDPLPETMLLGMRGRALADIVDHPLVRQTPGIRITGAVNANGRLGLTTDARSPVHLQAIAPVLALAA